MKANGKNGIRNLAIALSLTGLLASGGLIVSQANASSTGIIDIRIGEKGSIETVTTKNGQIDPLQAGPDIPIRVVTTYTHENISTSDPSIVAGKSGLIRIDVSVYNTTGRLEKVSADVDGSSVRQNRWVSTPISVAASVRLPGLTAEEIVTPSISTELGQDNAPVTNGVVGLDNKGIPAVQWAGLTGVDKSVARFSLVLNTNEFKVPTFDVLAQPGFGINTNTKEQKIQSDLVAATIETLGKAEDVLADSGDALGKARNVLGNAGDRIGQKTIADLNASNSRIESSASRTISTLSGINSQVSSAFASTNATLGQQLLATTASVKNLLGDPSQVEPAIKIDEATCAFVPQDAGAPNQGAEDQENEPNVLSVVRSLSASLEALADTNRSCQKKLLADLNAIIGPEEPDQSLCEKADSLTCKLWQTNQSLSGFAEQNLKNSIDISNKIANGSQKNAVSASQALTRKVAELDASLNNVKKTDKTVKEKLNAVSDTLREIDEPLTRLDENLVTIAFQAREIGGASEQQDKSIRAAKWLICTSSGKTKSKYITDPSQAQKISPDTADLLLKVLSETDCPAEDEDAAGRPEHDGKPLTENREPSVEVLGHNIRENVSAISEITADPEVESYQPAAKRALSDLRSAISEISAKTNDAIAAESSDASLLQEKLADLIKAQTNLQEAAKKVSQTTGDLDKKIDSYAEELRNFATLSNNNSQKILDADRAATQLNIRSAKTRITQTSDDLFNGISDQLSGQSQQLLEKGTNAVNASNQGVKETNDNLATSASNLFNKNSSELEKATSLAITDAGATSSLLAEDIARVLADIGTNSDKGTGLLGAMATSQAHLGLADSKLSDSTSQMNRTQSTQRRSQTESVLDSVALRSCLARLERPFSFPNPSGSTATGWFSFHLSTDKAK